MLCSVGTPISPADYAKMNPNGRAILKGAQYRAALDDVCEEYPFSLATGRNHLHFHTRTKTGRSKRLRHADHDPYVQIHEDDAKKLDIKVSAERVSWQLCIRADDLPNLRTETLSRWRPETERPNCPPRSARLKKARSSYLSTGDRINKVDTIT